MKRKKKKNASLQKQFLSALVYKCLTELYACSNNLSVEVLPRLRAIAKGLKYTKPFAVHRVTTESPRRASNLFIELCKYTKGDLELQV